MSGTWFAIGIDAGASTTRGVLIDMRGNSVATAISGGSNLRSVPAETAAKNLTDVIRALSAERTIAAICIGAAGAGRPQDSEELARLVRAVVPPGAIVDVRTDAEIALAAATSRRPAMIVIAGTGSIAYGEGNGKTARAGGYGALIGDPGSAYSIGEAALQRTARAFDAGELKQGTLAAAVADKLAATDLPALIARVTCWPPDVSAIAALAPLVGQLEKHDPDAHAIAAHAATDLGKLAVLVAHQVRGADPLPVALHGGAFQALPSLAHGVREALAATGGCDFVSSTDAPALGAARLALRAVNPGEPPAR